MCSCDLLSLSRLARDRRLSDGEDAYVSRDNHLAFPA
jgi:hypothetical protein